jgi:hypothetical protein
LLKKVGASRGDGERDRVRVRKGEARRNGGKEGKGKEERDIYLPFKELARNALDARSLIPIISSHKVENRKCSNRLPLEFETTSVPIRTFPTESIKNRYMRTFSTKLRTIKKVFR